MESNNSYINKQLPLSNQKNFLVLSDEEKSAIKTLVEAKTPITVFGPRRKYTADLGQEFFYTSWKSAKPTISAINKAKAGSAVVALTGKSFDLVDVDPRNGGIETFDKIKHLLPEPFAVVETPSGGNHYYIQKTGFPVVHFGGIDYLADGGIVFLPGTLRPKHANRGYKWLMTPRIDPMRQAETEFVEALMELSTKHSKSKYEIPRVSSEYLQSTSLEIINIPRLLSWAHNRVAMEVHGQRNLTLYKTALFIGKTVPNEAHLLSLLTESLMSACKKNGLEKEDGASACISTISSGFFTGQMSKEN